MGHDPAPLLKNMQLLNDLYPGYNILVEQVDGLNGPPKAEKAPRRILPGAVQEDGHPFQTAWEVIWPSWKEGNSDEFWRNGGGSEECPGPDTGRARKGGGPLCPFCLPI